ncbi:bromodomain associated protein [Ceratobasidium sp. AG-Ba]|nr:bromodomain associated protein [Ceratobasidium sp. AG-Ba]
MPLPGEQQSAAQRVLDVIFAHKVKNRFLSEMFKDLPDRAAWAEYYKVIPEPRALNNIKDKLEKGKYKTAGNLYSDIELVFANAIHFNEENSVISNDARILQGILKREWNAAVEAGTLPKIEEEIDPPLSEAPSSANSRQPPRPARTRDVATPATPSIRLPKKAATSTPSASRPATATPAPQSHTPAPQPVIPVQAAIQAPRPIQPIVSTVPLAPVPIPTLVPVPTPAPIPVPAPVPVEPDEDGTDGLVRDKQGDEIVQQLEATFPRCPPPGPEGWLELAADVDPMESCMSILNQIREFKDSGGDRAADVLECLPEETTSKLVSFDASISVALIENKIRARVYASAKDFDVDMSRLFEKARRWHEEGTYSYGRVLVLQCLWHNLTSPKQEDMQVDVMSSGASALGTSGSATFKGIVYSPGDWVHLANKEAPSKPIVAQVQRIERVDSAKMLTLTWYCRPEQTVHNATRTFWEREVFKTGYTTSHPLQDIIEPVACQFFPKHIRGRPSPPAWYPGRPLYVCESRYDSSSKTFSRIKNWTSCIPDGVRRPTNSSDWEYMPILKFASPSNKPVVPRKLPSPFLKGMALLKKRGGQGGNATTAPQKDRSLMTAVGGPTVVQASVVDMLPEETTKHFDRDPHTNQLLWFSGAPIETPRIHARQPRHSLDYLYYLARQRERQHRGEDLDESRRKSAVVPPLSTELANLYNEVFTNERRDERLRMSMDRNGDVEMSV